MLPAVLVRVPFWGLHVADRGLEREELHSWFGSDCTVGAPTGGVDARREAGGSCQRAPARSSLFLDEVQMRMRFSVWRSFFCLVFSFPSGVFFFRLARSSSRLVGRLAPRLPWFCGL